MRYHSAPLLRELTNADDPMTEQPGWVRAEHKRKAGPPSVSRAPT
jgi:hypothetical protein